MKKILLITALIMSNNSFAQSNIDSHNKNTNSNEINVSDVEHVQKECLNAFLSENPSKIEKIISLLKKDTTITYENKKYASAIYEKTKSGDYRALACYQSIAALINHNVEMNADLTFIKGKIKSYQKIEPQSDLGYLFEAELEDSISWKIRGTDSISNVTEEQIKNAAIHKINALKLLDKSNQDPHYPFWYSTRISIEGSFPFKDKEILKDETHALMESVVIYPDYLLSYVNFAQTVQPKWGGDWKEVDKVALLANHMNHEKYGNQYYSKVYAGIICCSKLEGAQDNVSLFNQSTNEVLKAYPTDYNYNQMAKAACALNNHKKLKELFGKIKTINQDVWNYPEFLQKCTEESKN